MTRVQYDRTTRTVIAVPEESVLSDKKATRLRETAAAAPMRVVRLVGVEGLMEVETPTVEGRFLVSYREPSTDDPGLVQTDDGKVYVVLPDGTRVQVTGGGGGGSQTLAQVLEAGGDPEGNPVTGLLDIELGEGVAGLYLLAETFAGQGIQGGPDGFVVFDNQHGANLLGVGFAATGKVTINADGVVTISPEGDQAAFISRSAVSFRVENQQFMSAAPGSLFLNPPSAGAILQLTDFSDGSVGLVNIEDGNKLSFFGAAGITQPVVPLTTPDVQNVIDALVALGLVTQSD